MKRKTEEEAVTNKSTEWDDILCSICMEHPHNAVILRCSSYDKCCRAYICDTSHMLSNCLNRFIKQSSVPIVPPSLTSVIYRSNLQPSHLILLSGGEANFNLNENEDNAPGGTSENNSNSMLGMHLAGEEYLESEYYHDPSFSCQPGMSVKCPMCRGVVTSWDSAGEGIKHLNLLKRSCSHDSCAFSGNYHKLCQHSWIKHRGASPIKTDPIRERSWHRLERQRERDDIVNALQSETPGAVLHVDLAIERDELSEDVSGDDQTLDPIYIHQSTNAIASTVMRQSLFSSTHQQVVESPLEPWRSLWEENPLGLHMHHDEDIIVLQDHSNVNISTDVDGDGDLSPARRRQEN